MSIIKIMNSEDKIIYIFVTKIIKIFMKNIFFASLLLTLNVFGQSNLQSRMYSAFTAADEPEWKSVISEMQQSIAKKYDPKMVFELVKSEYVYIAYLNYYNRNNEIKPYLSDAYSHLKKLVDIYPEENEYRTLYASLTLGQLYVNPLKSIFRINSSLREIKRCYEKDRNNPLVMLDYANILYYLPAFMGGDKEEAFRVCDRLRVKLLSDNSLKKDQKWYSLYSLVAASMARAYNKETEVAIADLKRILQVEPDMNWIKNRLLPVEEKKLREKKTKQ